MKDIDNIEKDLKKLEEYIKILENKKTTIEKNPMVSVLKNDYLLLSNNNSPTL